VNLDMATERATVEAELITWMAVHGNILLALRHPRNDGPSGRLVSDFAQKLGRMLVDGGLLTEAELAHTYQVEREERGRAS